MDRLPRSIVACGLGLLLAATGCRSTRPEVPPGRPFAKDGQQRKAIEFSSDGHPASAAASANFMPDNLGGSKLASGIGSNASRPPAAAFGAPPGDYGPPGTSGTAQGSNPTTDQSTLRTSGAPANMPPMSAPPTLLPPLDAPPAGAPPMPELNVTPERAPRDVPNPMNPPATDKPGALGTPEQPPIPN